MPEKLEPREVVKEQLVKMRAEHMHILMVALGKSHPDLATIKLQDDYIQRIDRALEYLKHYPTQGYGLAEEPSSSPKVFSFMKKFMPKWELPKLRKPPVKPTETPEKEE